MASKKLQIVGLDIPQSDWNQTDDTQIDYIKNKPTLAGTIVDGAEIFNDYENNETNIQNGHIEGVNNKAIITGFKMLSATEVGNMLEVTMDSVDGLSVGMKMNYFFCYPDSPSTVYKGREIIKAVDATNRTLSFLSAPINESNSTLYGEYTEGNLLTLIEQGQNDLRYYSGCWLLPCGVDALGDPVVGTTELIVDDTSTVHMEGKNNKGYLNTSDAGTGNINLGYAAVMHGYYNKNFGERNDTGGYRNTNNGQESFIRGDRNTIGSGELHDVSGQFNTVLGKGNFIRGLYNVVKGTFQTVFGKYNKWKENLAFIVGNGTSENNRSNALEVDWDGNAVFAGNVEAADVILGNLSVKESLKDVSNAVKGTVVGRAIHIDDVSSRSHLIDGMVIFNNYININELVGGNLVDNVDGTYTLTKAESGETSSNLVKLQKPIPQGTSIRVLVDSYEGNASQIVIQFLSADHSQRMGVWLANHSMNRAWTTTFEVGKVRLIMYSSEGNGNYVTISNLQVINDPTLITITEEISGETYTPSIDGSFEMKSISPTMNIVSDNENVDIEIIYNRDINSELSMVMDTIADVAEESKTYTDEKVAGIVNSAPETLDTLKELSEALNNDADFATTVVTELGKKESLDNKTSYIDDTVDDTKYPDVQAIRNYVDLQGFKIEMVEGYEHIDVSTGSLVRVSLDELSLGTYLLKGSFSYGKNMLGNGMYSLRFTNWTFVIIYNVASTRCYTYFENGNIYTKSEGISNEVEIPLTSIENMSNKKTSIESSNITNIDYPSIKAVVDYVAEQISNAENYADDKIATAANAIKSTVSGKAITVDDLSPIEHTVKAKITLAEPYTDPTEAKITRYGSTNMFDINKALTDEVLTYDGEDYTLIGNNTITEYVPICIPKGEMFVCYCEYRVESASGRFYWYFQHSDGTESVITINNLYDKPGIERCLIFDKSVVAVALSYDCMLIGSTISNMVLNYVYIGIGNSPMGEYKPIYTDEVTYTPTSDGIVEFSSTLPLGVLVGDKKCENIDLEYNQNTIKLISDNIKKNSNTLRTTLYNNNNDNIIELGNVSPVEHDVEIKIASHNLLDCFQLVTSKYRCNHPSDIFLNGVDSDNTTSNVCKLDDVVPSGTPITISLLRFGVSLSVSDWAEVYPCELQFCLTNDDNSASEIVTFSSDSAYVPEGGYQGSSKSKTVVLDFDLSHIYLNIANLERDVMGCIKNVQVEIGNTATNWSAHLSKKDTTALYIPPLVNEVIVYGHRDQVITIQSVSPTMMLSVDKGIIEYVKYNQDIDAVLDNKATKEELHNINFDGGGSNIEGSTLKGFNNNGIFYGRRISDCQLCVVTFNENGAISDVVNIDTTYDNSDPEYRAKGTFVYEGNTYEFENVGDMQAVTTALNLNDNQDIQVKLLLAAGAEDVEVGMSYHLCYPKGTKIRYGKITACMGDWIVVNNEAIGIDRYFSIYGIPTCEDGDYYGSIVIDGGETGEFEILKAEGLTLHVEGVDNFSTLGGNSRGFQNKVKQFAASSDGEGNKNTGYGSRTSGVKNKVSGDLASADGELNEVDGYASHSTGSHNKVQGNYSNGLGLKNIITGDYTDGGGANNTAEGNYGFVRGFTNKIAKMASSAFGALCEVLANYGFAAGYKNKVTKDGGIALGYEVESNGVGAIATGKETKADADCSFTTGLGTVAKYCQTAIGTYNLIDEDGKYFFVIGNGASDSNRSNIFTVDKSGNVEFKGRAYADGERLAYGSELLTKIKDGEGAYAIKFGTGTQSIGEGSIAGGINSVSNGRRSVSIGQWTLAGSDAQAVFGKFNIKDENNKYVLILGNGKSDANRSNAFTVDFNGNVIAQGKITTGQAPVADMDLATKGYVDNNVGEIPLNEQEYALDIEVMPNVVTNIAELQGELTVHLLEGEVDRANWWEFRITQGATAQTVTLPEIKWEQLNIAPIFGANTTTICHLYYINNVLCGEWVAV